MHRKSTSDGEACGVYFMGVGLWFIRGKDIAGLTTELEKQKSKDPKNNQKEEFSSYLESGKLSAFIANQGMALTAINFDPESVQGSATATAFGLLDRDGSGFVKLSSIR